MTIKKFLFVIFVMFVLFVPSSVVFAEAGGFVNTDPVPLQFAPPCIPVKGIAGLDTCGAQLTSTSPIQDYLIRLYQFAVGISGIVAVGMIVWGAIKISFFSESITQKSEGGEMIRNAVTGIALLLGSYLILRTVNPRIVSLGTALSSDTVPQNTTSTRPLDFVPPVACANPKTIPGADGSYIGNADPDPNNSCRYRKLFIYKDGITISSGDTKYYNYTFNQNLPPNTIVWAYPYYVTSEGVSSAKCLIYAYKQQSDKNSVFVDLQPTLQPCILDSKTPQEPGYAKTGIATGVDIPSSTQALANSIISDQFVGGLGFSASADCNPVESSAAGAITAMAQGKAPLICQSGCKTSGALCIQTGVYLNDKMLTAMRDYIAGGGLGTVTSITGGDHASNSAHYTGNAIDMTTDKGISAYNTMIAKLNSLGLSAYCEYPTNGVVKLHTTCGSDAAGAGNLHLHIQTYPNGNAIP